jgi:hypothetical protein
MAEIGECSGVAVGVVDDPYPAFVVRETGEKVEAGERLWLFVVRSFDEEPVKIKVPKEMRGTVGAIEEYGSVKVTYSLWPNGRTLERRLESCVGA